MKKRGISTRRNIRAYALTTSLSLAGALLGGGAFADPYTYSTVFDPAGVSTQIRGLNDSGTVVGRYYTDATHYYGFEESGGVYTAIDPGVAYTAAFGINDSGTVVGASAGHGFEYSPSSGIYTSFNINGAAQTFLRGINNAGAMVGYYADKAGVFHGFLDEGGVITNIGPPGLYSAIPTGINNLGVVVGAYTDQFGRMAGFVETDNLYSTIYVPGSTYTGILGVNDSGVLVGYYGNGKGAELPFTESGGVYSFPSVPGANTNTDVNAINNTGEIAGYATQIGGTQNGYTAVDPTLPVSVNLLGKPADQAILLPLEAIGSVTAFISGTGTQEFYKFVWSGGQFISVASIASAEASAGFEFELLNPDGSVNQDITLDGADGFTGNIQETLAPGTYTIGLIADGPADPQFFIDFVTPLSGAVPEPTTWALMVAGLGLLGSALRRRKPTPAQPCKA